MTPLLLYSIIPLFHCIAYIPRRLRTENTRTENNKDLKETLSATCRGSPIIPEHTPYFKPEYHGVRNVHWDSYAKAHHRIRRNSKKRDTTSGGCEIRLGDGQQQRYNGERGRRSATRLMESPYSFVGYSSGWWGVRLCLLTRIGWRSAGENAPW